MFHLQNFIRKVIQNTLQQWSNEKLLITIESFKRKRDCLVIIRVRESGKKIITSNPQFRLQRTIFTSLKTFYLSFTHCDVSNWIFKHIFEGISTATYNFIHRKVINFIIITHIYSPLYVILVNYLFLHYLPVP